MFNRIYHPRLWRWVTFWNLNDLPNKPGIYTVRSWGPLGPIQYIGESSDLHARWTRPGRYEHHRKKQAQLLPFGILNYYVIEDHEHYELELIDQLGRPPWNWERKPHNSYTGAIWWGLKRTDWKGVFIIWFSVTLMGVLIFNVLT
ncbi:hypothetical protein Lepto7375DRAFT_7226 [Leptolyngbya sp. PCC 7375]|nr:hypothetical protein Lepto7375DRAFT_7226 [Leptolyngbya sp. PCC 7375]